MVANHYVIHFHSAFWPYTDGVKSCTVEADSYLNLVTNCFNLFPKLRKAIKKLIKQPGQEVWIAVGNTVLDSEKLLMKPSSTKKITLVPIIFGKGRFLGAIFAIAIIAFAVFALQPELVFVEGASELGLAGAAGGMAFTVGGGYFTSVLGLGLSLLFSSVLGLIFKPPKNKAPDSGARRDNDIFGSLQNTTTTQTPVALVYGMHRIAGQFVSGYVRTINHNKEDEIKLSNYI